jgi:exopolysaccharide biosynthesis polyprenyl glycosylphosphotransferase
MLKHLGNTFTLWLFSGDMLLTLAALVVARQLRLVLPFGLQVDAITGRPLKFEIDWTFYALVLIVWAAVFLTLPVYNSKRSLHAIGDLQITLVAIGGAVLILAGLAYFFYRDFSRVLFVYFTVIDAALLAGWRVSLRAALRVRHAAWPSSKRRVLIVGTGFIADEIAARIYDYAWTGLELIGFLSDSPAASATARSRFVNPAGTLRNNPKTLGTLHDAPQVVEREHIDEVVIALPLRAHQDMVDLISNLQRVQVSVRVVPDLFDLAFTRTGIEDLDGIPIVSLRDPVMTPVQRAVKRLFDLVIGSLALIVGAIPMALITIAIKRDSPGLIIFRQQRVGENGRLFWMLKFRTMIDRADAPTGEHDLVKRPDDPRLTRVGRWLRQFSLDELPQLFNVLKGDMSLVGPRPELPWLVDQYADWQRKRFNVPQGMTGWWQVNGRSDKPTIAKTRDDLYYIQNYSLLLDIIILWKTIGAVLRRRGAF